MDQIPVSQGIFQQGCKSVNVVLAHFSNVFKHETEGFEHTILDILFLGAVLVHQSRQYSEWSTSLCYDGNSHSGTDTILAFLHFEIVEQSDQDILGSNRPSNIAKSINSGSPDALLMGFQ